jgi:hypothetical protein
MRSVNRTRRRYIILPSIFILFNSINISSTISNIASFLKTQLFSCLLVRIYRSVEDYEMNRMYYYRQVMVSVSKYSPDKAELFTNKFELPYDLLELRLDLLDPTLERRHRQPRCEPRYPHISTRLNK